MPITKTPRKRQPLWREWDRLAQKEGVRDPVYSVSGDVYTGDWSSNKKHGKSYKLNEAHLGTNFSSLVLVPVSDLTSWVTLPHSP